MKKRHLFDNWKTNTNHKRKFWYLIVQLVILIIPPLLATTTYQVNLYVNNNYKEFLVYIGGISGLLVCGFTAELFESILSQTISSIILTLLYILLTVFCYVYFYKPTRQRIINITIINGYLSIWSVVFGKIFLYLAMQ